MVGKDTLLFFQCFGLEASEMLLLTPPVSVRQTLSLLIPVSVSDTSVQQIWSPPGFPGPQIAIAHIPSCLSLFPYLSTRGLSRCG